MTKGVVAYVRHGIELLFLATLAMALEALQSDEDVPEELLSIAEPIAR